MVYTSKVDIWLATIIWGTVALCYMPVFLEDGLIIGLVFGTIMAIVIGYLWKHTKYIIEGETLIIGTGIGKKIIPINSIVSLRPSSNIVSSPALSLSRIEITIGKWHSVYISPKEREQFVLHLLNINPNIELKK